MNNAVFGKTMEYVRGHRVIHRNTDKDNRDIEINLLQQKEEGNIQYLN